MGRKGTISEIYKASFLKHLPGIIYYLFITHKPASNKKLNKKSFRYQAGTTSLSPGHRSST